MPCQLFKHTPDATETATIHPYPTVDPFEFWEIDFVGPLDETRFGNKYLLTAIDYCTSTALAIPLIKRSAEAAKELMEQIIWTYGAPRFITTDNGSEFDSDEFMTYLKRYGIIRKPTSPGHPQLNGKVERLNHKLVQRLQRIAQEPGNSVDLWDLYLQHAFSVHINS